MTPLVAAGYARAQAVTRHHSKSFHFASLALFGARRRAAFALYAFCRRLDDLVDEAGAPADVPARLAAARAVVAAKSGDSGPWPDDELAAFRDTVSRFHIPPTPFEELINGMEMDLTITRYETFEALHTYCYRVAGVVGVMMTHVLGFDDARCLPFAEDLGTALQLTNILRDVKEDLGRGRIYLPANELKAFGLTEAHLAQFSAAGPRDPAVWSRWCEFMKFQIARARSYLARADHGIPSLTGFGSQRVVRLMSTVYGGILGAIERQQYDVFSRRARVWGGRKVLLAAQVLLTPNPRASATPPPLPSGVP